MMGNFTLDINKFVKKCGANADQAVRKTIFDLGKSVVERTPVGDATYWKSPPPPGYVGGRARGNWSHSVGQIKIEEFDVVSRSGSVSNARIAGSIPKEAAGKIHFIQNSLPYIQRLEDGWSRQCPPNGMVGLTMMEFQSIINKALEEIR
ncbi:MAG: hypothetical protein QMD11_07950 [Smithella sp.]|nr:hypothetical protein [Smithella sp.]